ncbi:MAG: hypothetical protein ACD_61C00204G0001 [uncultured bacterium]|nr:MAG: hypothetical protein ACD_61C00204G0001 [uncultured bacterium]
MHFFPAVVPFKLGELFFFRFSWEAFSNLPWTLLLLGPALTLIATLLTRNGHKENREIKTQLGYNLWTSIKAGIFEEAAFRWLIFFSLIIGFTLDNWLIGWLSSIGWIGSLLSLPWFSLILAVVGINVLGLVAYAVIESKSTGLFISTICLVILVIVGIFDFTALLIFTKFWYVKVMIPAINWLTLGKLSGQLFGYSWMVGAALISANGKFQDGHSYQGCIGWVNSWVIGMLMFCFVFSFGLPFAMLIHALYDILIKVIVYVDAMIESL